MPKSVPLNPTVYLQDVVGDIEIGEYDPDTNRLFYSKGVKPLSYAVEQAVLRLAKQSCEEAKKMPVRLTYNYATDVLPLAGGGKNG